MQLLGSFLMEMGVRRHRERKKSSSLTDWPGRHSQDFGGRRTSTSSSPQGKGCSPLHPDISTGNIHLQMASQSFQKDPLRVRGDVKLQVPRADLNNLSGNHLMGRYSGHPDKPLIETAETGGVTKSYFRWCHSHTLRALGIVLRAVTSCNIWKSFPLGNKDGIFLSFPH